MWPLLNAMIPRICHGCIYDCPSQRDHDVCLLADDEERLLKIYSEAWSMLNLKDRILESMLSDVNISNNTEEPDLILVAGKFSYSVM